ncbi:MAG TPA: hypothetical protein VFZ53_21240 [Polyangiaceae bacterium]
MKLSSVFVGLLALASLQACGEPEETCTCTCTCASGQKSTLDDAKDDEDCATACAATCGNDGYSTNYDCTTQG